MDASKAHGKYRSPAEKGRGLWHRMAAPLANSRLESGPSRLEQIPGDLLGDLFRSFFRAAYGLRFVSVDR